MAHMDLVSFQVSGSHLAEAASQRSGHGGGGSWRRRRRGGGGGVAPEFVGPADDDYDEEAFHVDGDDLEVRTKEQRKGCNGD